MSKKEHSEISVWEAFIHQDDRKAFEHIYQKYAPILSVYGLRYTSDKEVIKDCVQDVFIKVHDNRHQLKVTDNIGSYLFVSLKHSLLNHFRDKKIQLEISDCESYLVHERSAEDIFIEDEANELRKIKADTILASLSSRQREVMYYKFIENKKHEEIAQIMDMNYQSVSNLIQRAIGCIKKKYSDDK
ncbi:MAG: sigma-70 family RNA polymerase sigma factor [Bacteroidales bacterium]|nr:sigma-70 family RNA polymerase sigma factor [Bacteroidales bacterium]